MNLAATLSVYAYGTSEGVRKEWDARGRKGVSLTDLIAPKPKGMKTGKPLTVEAYHCSMDGDFRFREQDGTFFSPEATPEFGSNVYHATVSFKNPLVTTDGAEAAKVFGDKKLAEDYENLLEGVDNKGEALMGDTSGVWLGVDTRIASLARSAGYDGIVFTDHDDLNPMQYMALNQNVISGLKKVGVYDWKTTTVR